MIFREYQQSAKCRIQARPAVQVTGIDPLDLPCLANDDEVFTLP